MTVIHCLEEGEEMLASGIVRGLRRLESSTDTELDKLERTSLEKQTV